MESEVLVNISLRLPASHPDTLGEALAPLVEQAIKIGGPTIHMSLTPYDPEEDL